jgi:hypothetical protein
MIDPLVRHLVSISLALLLLPAAWHKVRRRDEFVAALAGYHLLPAALLQPMSVLIPALEAVLGLGWLAGRGSGAVAIVTIGLLGTYASAIAVNLLRGRVHIDCGCSLGTGSGRDRALSWWLVARNVLLVGAVALTLLPAATRELGYYDGLTLVLALPAVALLYAAGSQLLSNRSALAAWAEPRD